MAVKTEITACLKHNRIDNKSVVCESFSHIDLLPKVQSDGSLVLASKLSSINGCNIIMLQREGEASEEMGTAHRGTLQYLRGLCLPFLIKIHGQCFFRNGLDFPLSTRSTFLTSCLSQPTQRKQRWLKLLASDV